ncbi:MAG TPA: peptidylprolyl isomerase [Desulfurococcales archaeon]|nr:peptidylprolyl isomerase [Desulfurococcales archaeon]
MPFTKGDFLLIDYIAKIKETNEVFDTTMEEVAKKEKIYREDKVYEPLLVIIGEGRVVRGLEEELQKMNVGEEKEVEVEPKKAYGERDPSKVKMVSIREFSRRGIVPKVGEIVEINGVPAVVRSITGGRVIVDFNHPLAGKTIVFKVKVLKKIDDELEKVKYLVHRRIRMAPIAKIEVERKEKEIIIKLPRESYLAEDIQYAKQALAREIARYIPGVSIIKFVEEYRVEEAGK